MCDPATRALRPQWQELSAGVSTLGPEEFARRWNQSQEIIRENGVTYNVYGDPEGMDRLLTFDAVPHVLPNAEWQRIEAAAVQRAHLLNLVLTDLYGPQNLIRHDRVPAGLVMANPGFLRPCHGIPMPGNTFLHAYAADLGRAPDGNWWVLSDRTQAPSGAGYALENRQVQSQTFPDLLRQSKVRRLDTFFQTWRDHLQALARPAGLGNPRFVLLTPGPYNETYFEHAFLARYLGFTLAQGEDLTIRESRLYLKTLEGLTPVDGLLRRVDEDFCDPLEMRGDSTLGVAGLMQAVRAGNLVVANALGSGLVESPALMAFLPTLCRHVLGEELKLPSIATWWCGQAQPRQYVLDNLKRLVIKPAFANSPVSTLRGQNLTQAQLAELKEKIRFRPHDYIAQEDVELSCTPTWNGSSFEPASMTLRLHVGSGRDGYHAMQGGLTRFSHGPAVVHQATMQQGGGSKDTWILLNHHPNQVMQPLPQEVPLTLLRRGGTDLPCRVADNLYWLGRYGERADQIARLLRAIFLMLANETQLATNSPLSVITGMLRLRGVIHAPDPVVNDALGFARFERQLIGELCSPDSMTNLAAQLQGLHRTASNVRDRLSLDTWRILCQIQVLAERATFNRDLGPSEFIELFNDIIFMLAALNGMSMENMLRGHGWLFMDTGRRLERSLYLTGLLQSSFVMAPADEPAVIDSVLRVCESVMIYRSRYLNQYQITPMLDLLITDRTNPRSLLYQMLRLRENLQQMPKLDDNPLPAAHLRAILNLCTRVELADPMLLGEMDHQRRRSNLGALLWDIAGELPKISEALTLSFFTLSTTRRQ